MKLGQLVTSTASLQYISNLKLSPVKSFKVAGFIKKVNHHLEAWQTVNQGLAAKHAHPDGKFKTDEDMKEYNASASEVLNQDVDDVEPSILLTYPEDFAKNEKIVPQHVAVLTNLFVEHKPQTVAKEYKIKRFELLHSSMCLNQLSQMELPNSVAHSLVDNMVAIRKLATEWDAAEQDKTPEWISDYRNEEVTVNLYPIKVTSFGDTDVAPGLLFPLYWLIEE
jgi:hypothetical protein